MPATRLQGETRRTLRAATAPGTWPSKRPGAKAIHKTLPRPHAATGRNARSWSCSPAPTKAISFYVAGQTMRIENRRRSIHPAASRSGLSASRHLGQSLTLDPLR
jgi:hypothetical protein